MQTIVGGYWGKNGEKKQGKKENDFFLCPFKLFV